MPMIDRLARRASLWTLVITSLIAILTGIHINILTDGVDEAHGVGIVDSLVGMGFWNVVPLFVLSLLVVQYKLSVHSDGKLAGNADELIDDILTAAAKSLELAGSNRFRGFVKLHGKDDHLRVHHSHNADGDAERTLTYRTDFGVSGKAFMQRRTFIEELSPAHVNDYDTVMRLKIRPDIRTVIASPMMRAFVGNDPPIGVLTFDSTKTPDELGFDPEQTKVLSQAWADIIAKLVIIRGT